MRSRDHTIPFPAEALSYPVGTSRSLPLPFDHHHSVGPGVALLESTKSFGCLTSSGQITEGTHLLDHSDTGCLLYLTFVLVQ